MPDLLIIADDLSGAADAAAAAGGGALVALDGLRSDASPIVALDLDSRRLAPDAARQRARHAVEAVSRPDTLIYQKMDSLLRGNWVAELKGIRQALGAQLALAIIAPAWPERGRTTIGGRLHVDGQPVESRGLSDDAGQALRGDLAAHLTQAGVTATIVRAGSQAEISAQLQAASASEQDAVICDADHRADLDRIAVASLGLEARPVWVGSGGLVSSLIRATGRAEAATQPALAATGSCLIVVGSASAISRRQLAALEAEGVEILAFDPSEHDPDGSLRRSIEDAIAAGRDIAVTIAGHPGGALHSGVIGALADAIASVLPRIDGLILTGGETARAVLDRAGVHAIRIVDEIEPGLPLGVTLGHIQVPVVTKAGAFGDAYALCAALYALKHPADLSPPSQRPSAQS